MLLCAPIFQCWFAIVSSYLIIKHIILKVTIVVNPLHNLETPPKCQVTQDSQRIIVLIGLKIKYKCDKYLRVKLYVL